MKLMDELKGQGDLKDEPKDQGISTEKMDQEASIHV